MKTIKIIAAILFVTNLIAQQPNPMDFFPAQVGNIWEYYGTQGFYREHFIKDSLTNNGKRFIFIFEDKPSYLIDDFNIYEISFYTSKLSLIYKLDANVGENWFVVLPDSENSGIKGLLKSEYNSQIFSVPIVTKEIWYYSLAWGDTSIQYGLFLEKKFIASSFGLVAHYSENNEPYFILQGCVINGDTFGTLTNVYLEKNYNYDFSLNQNYPNPFNNATNIEYTIKEENYVELAVYNVLGEKVAILVDERKLPGKYSINFSSNSLPSGIYIYRLKEGNRIISRKMTLLK